MSPPVSSPPATSPASMSAGSASTAAALGRDAVVRFTHWVLAVAGLTRWMRMSL